MAMVGEIVSLIIMARATWLSVNQILQILVPVASAIKSLRIVSLLASIKEMVFHVQRKSLMVTLLHHSFILAHQIISLFWAFATLHVILVGKE